MKSIMKSENKSNDFLRKYVSRNQKEVNMNMFLHLLSIMRKFTVQYISRSIPSFPLRAEFALKTLARASYL